MSKSSFQALKKFGAFNNKTYTVLLVVTKDENFNDDSSDDDSTGDDSSDDDSTRDDSSSDDNFINNSPGYGRQMISSNPKMIIHLKRCFLMMNMTLKKMCIKLKSLPGMRGIYGKVGPNEKIPYFHLFITVDFKNVDEAVLKDKIDQMFGPNASRYFEFRPKPSKTQSFNSYQRLQ
ncbi:uncharacterized membrane protein-like [Xenia sp. Carnegie-2017]|uniref:uncharacterized membrane protein-like n=1 Tax=Xenia sp. Carnegie-2017 TaxID=2897299 RepID=UPI001F03C2FE|nr:uncharacterized membrane protein-like [Xenia sp. Carnegie-2017]